MYARTLGLSVILVTFFSLANAQDGAAPNAVSTSVQRDSAALNVFSQFAAACNWGGAKLRHTVLASGVLVRKTDDTGVQIPIILKATTAGQLRLELNDPDAPVTTIFNGPLAATTKAGEVHGLPRHVALSTRAIICLS